MQGLRRWRPYHPFAKPNLFNLGPSPFSLRSASPRMMHLPRACKRVAPLPLSTCKQVADSLPTWSQMVPVQAGSMQAVCAFLDPNQPACGKSSLATTSIHKLGFQMAPNGSKWPKVVPDCPKWPQIVPNCLKLPQMANSGSGFIAELWLGSAQGTELPLA